MRRHVRKITKVNEYLISSQFSTAYYIFCVCVFGSPETADAGVVAADAEVYRCRVGGVFNYTLSDESKRGEEDEHIEECIIMWWWNDKGLALSRNIIFKSVENLNNKTKMLTSLLSPFINPFCYFFFHPTDELSILAHFNTPG